MSTLPPMGLIAGEGRLPLLEAQGLRAAGRSVVCVGLNGGGGGRHGEVAALCDRYASVPLLRLGAWVRKLKKWGAHEAVMVGRVRKTTAYSPWAIARGLPDLRVGKLWFGTLRHDRRSQTVLAALADELSKSGIELLDTTQYIPDHLATAGVMTRLHPGAGVQADLDFAWPVLLRMNDLEIGQALAVKGRDILAVEAIEGTDAMIERAGTLCRGRGWTLCKGAGPGKDLRFDVPTVGVGTIEKLAAAGGKCLAVEVGRVILVDKPAVLEAADNAGIAVVGVAGDGVGPGVSVA